MENTQKSSWEVSRAAVFNYLVCLVCILFAASLLAISFWGIGRTLRSPAIYTEPGTLFENDITLTPEQLWSQVPLLAEESQEEYVTRLTLAVNRSMAHYWEDEGADRYNLHIPVWENWILYAEGLVFPHARKYEFQDYRMALDRGVGLCSQHSLALKGLLHKQGINIDAASLNGHVVNIVRLDDGRRLVCDADYGLVLPHSLEELRADPDLVAGYYAGAVNLDQVLKAYSGPSVEGSDLFASVRENALYVLKWLIPTLLLVIGVIGMWRCVRQ